MTWHTHRTTRSRLGTLPTCTADPHPHHGRSRCVHAQLKFPCAQAEAFHSVPRKPAPSTAAAAAASGHASTHYRKDAVSRDHCRANPYRVCDSGPVDVHHSRDAAAHPMPSPVWTRTHPGIHPETVGCSCSPHAEPCVDPHAPGHVPGDGWHRHARRGGHVEAHTRATCGQPHDRGQA